MNDRFNPRHPLHGAFTKHLRAAEQATALRLLIESNAHNERHHRLTRERTDTELLYKYEPISLPLVWSVMLGEIVHNCRSALDHIVTQLMLRNNSHGRPLRQNEFPVHLTKERFDQRSPGQLAGLSQEDRDLIESFQPYKAKEEDIDPLSTPIYLLNEIWNIDKHRLVPLLVSDELALEQLHIEPAAPGEWRHPPGPITKGTIVYRRPRTSEPQTFDVTCHVTRDVCISDTGSARPTTTNVGPIMDTIVAFVDDVLTKVDRRFPIYY